MSIGRPIDIINNLIKANASLDIQNKAGVTALMLGKNKYKIFISKVLITFF